MSAINPLFKGILQLAGSNKNVYDYYISPECQVRIMDNIYTTMDIPLDYSVEKKGEYLGSLINQVRQLRPGETNNTSANNIEAICQEVMRKFRAHPDREQEVIEETLDRKRSSIERENNWLIRLGLPPNPPGGTGRRSIDSNNPFFQNLQTHLQETLQSLEQQLAEGIVGVIERAIAPPMDNCHDPKNF